MKKFKPALKIWTEFLMGRRVLVSRSDMAKAWRDQVNPRPCIPDKLHHGDIYGSCYDSAFNDFCRQLGLKEE